MKSHIIEIKALELKACYCKNNISFPTVMWSHEFYVSAPNDCKGSAASTKACMRNELG